MGKRILIFDFDGTLADTQELVMAGYNVYAAKHGYAQVKIEDIPAMRKASASENFKKFKVPFWRVLFMIWRVRRNIREGVSRLDIDPEVKSALLDLYSQGHDLYIVSSNSERSINGFLRHNAITIFKEVHSVFDLFGKGDFLNKLIKKKRWNRADVFYIGDEIRDIEAAKTARVNSIAVTWGYNDHDALVQAGAGRVIERRGDLKDI